MIQAFIVHADAALAWRVFPDLVKRIRAFAAKYEPKTNTDELIKDLEKAFLERSPGMFGIVGFDERGLIVGHALLRIETYYGRRALCVMQAERDKGSTTDDEFRNAFMEILRTLARKVKAAELRTLALSKVHERYYQRLGWETERIVMVHPVGDDDGRIQD